MSQAHIDVKYVADLARIELSDEELQTFQGQLEAILGHIEQLQTVDVEGIEPTAHASPVFDRTRPDAHRPGFGPDILIKNAPDSSGDQLRVPKVVDA
ncbi:Asp-tRNA(Asn)/Glu-tRNA(Gln) amidotransferase subunit GatC [Persicirhabdus sediminis]|uniref:Aspartyl/glutamyl-tRNA(Asn/Gln) amidotransferase subunit C n=1 Tax=Persicirhabdus sediminis TaxID=454144 RepID=A0A8J7MDI2_9BACT|nr:Asp-tRNA(Asn)/Glu-tRNA(Gln) amidotransferase subunit GatC [Persicirhabdus sediminis]MBK1791417.1 Asp-tRNA(Asn)/Glu-tRNA(Gln) amidotransferase subunit GatC [Persicirhabdus sediminis]